jgi:hypothetical protein
MIGFMPAADCKTIAKGKGAVQTFRHKSKWEATELEGAKE